MEKNIVILGGGFGGIRAALNLEKRLGNKKDLKIILIDQNTYHLYTASLYEVASGELSSRCILLPYHKILKRKRIEFMNARVSKLDPRKKTIETSSGDKIPYWKMVFALGSDTEDFGVPGVSQYAIGLKSSTDAEKIYQHLMHCSVTKKGVPIKVIVGGGGFSGVETAGELTQHRKCPLQITVVEAAPKILPGMPDKVSKAVTRQLNFLGVKVITSSPIKEVKEDEVILANGHVLPYDLMIWTAGVRGSRFIDTKVFELDKKKALVVNKHLQVKGFNDIFAIGDAASTGVAWTATKAEEDAKVAAHNIIQLAHDGKNLRNYKVFEPPLIVPAGKRWAAAKIGKFILIGKISSILKDFVLLYYLLTILPPITAFRVWWGGECEVLEIKKPETASL